MHIDKPSHFGDAYYCYEGFTSILLLACVNSVGLITYLRTGLPGSCGDAAAYNDSMLKRNIAEGRWLSGFSAKANRRKIPLYLVGDAAFSFSSRLMKCDSTNPPDQQTERQKAFNYSVCDPDTPRCGEHLRLPEVSLADTCQELHPRSGICNEGNIPAGTEKND